MEILMSLNSSLKDILKDIENVTVRQALVIEHIKNVTKNKLSILEFARDQDWFNVSQPLEASILRGKIVVLDFFTYCCINCIHLIPHLRALEENFSISDGLVVIGVHSAKFKNEKNSSNIASALRRYNVTHPTINDATGYMWDKFQISCWPTVVIIGPNGEALFVLIGEEIKDELFLYVECTLKYYRDKISSHSLPIISCSNVISSHILSFPGKIDRFQDILVLSDSGHHCVLICDDSGQILHKIGGNVPGFQDGTFEKAKFNSPQGVAFYDKYEIYVADTENHAIRLIDLHKSKVITVAGTGNQGRDYIGGKIGTAQEISSPWDLCFVSSGHIKHNPLNNLLLNETENEREKKTSCIPPLPGSTGFVPKPPPLPVLLDDPVTKNKCQNLNKNNVLLIAMSGIHQIWALFLEDTLWWKGKKYKKNVCVAIAGSGKEENRNNSYPMMASFAQPSGLAYCSNLKSVFIADSESSSIRKLSLENGSVSHVVGGDKNPINLFNFGDIDGKGFNAKLQHPLGITCCELNNTLIICDTYNNKLKQIDLSDFECRKLHEDNLFNEPSGCCLNETEDILYITDTNNNSVVIFNLKTKALEKLNIRETPIEQSNSNISFDNLWELEANISSKKGEIALELAFKAEDIHGTWKYDASTNVKSNALKGEISAASQVLHFSLLPTDPGNNDFINLFLNLSFCEANICRFRKCMLKIIIKRSLEGVEFTKLELNEVVG